MEASETTHPFGNLTDYGAIIWRRKWFVASLTLIVTLITFVVSTYFVAPRYTSSSELLIENSGVEKALFGTSVFDNATYQMERDVKTRAEMIKSPQVVEAVQKRLGVTDSVADKVDVNSVKDTNVIRITAVDTDPNIARDLADGFATEFIEWRRQSNRSAIQDARLLVEQQLARAQPANQDALLQKLEDLRISEVLQTGNVELIKNASVALTPVSPKPVQNTVIAFVVSLIAGCGLALLLNNFDTNIRETGEIEKEVKLPIIGMIPPFHHSYNGLYQPIITRDPVGNEAESFRALRTNLQYVDLNKNVKSMIITSMVPSEGKTTTLVNLALALAIGGKKVIILDADFRRPTVYKHLSLENSIGLTNAVAGNCTLREVLQMVDLKELSLNHLNNNREAYGDSGNTTMLYNSHFLYCATTGPIPPNPGEIVSSHQFKEIINEAKGYADYVLVDTPPLMSVGDAAGMASSVDGMILVIKLLQTSRNVLPHAQKFIEMLPCTPLGVVVTNLSSRKTDGYYGYDYATNFPD